MNKQPVDALAMIVHQDEAFHKGQKLVSKLKRLIPRQLYEVPIQAAIGKHIVSRANVKALRKDVLAKCYGGDVTRKKKLLEKLKKRQAPPEDDRKCRSPAGSVYGRVEVG